MLNIMFTLWTRHPALLLLLVAGTGRRAVPAVNALPSFGSKLPNGERVPCPATDDGSYDDDGCINGYCRGLGHGSCGGGRSASPSSEVETESLEDRINLNPFGQDYRDAGFVWTTDLCNADSDGDGYTNGEELGDPCCVWTYGTRSGVAPYTANFVPSHPGNADHSLPESYVRPACGTGETAVPGKGQGEGDADVTTTGIAAFNPGETQESFEFRIKDYPIPRKTTTYVDFVFNLPEDLPDIVHVVFGEALVSQPKHLHHFVVQGCASRVPDEMEGVALERTPEDCNLPVGGFSGWAPGVTMWPVPTDAGVPIGKNFGIQALQINVHYTDGNAPYLNGETAIATDGVRVYYTPDLRPKTVTNTPVINVGFGPKDMTIPAGKERAFMTRTCTVTSRCRDRDDATMNMIGSQVLNDPDLTCEKGAKSFYCISDLFQLACPASCGLCEDGSPRKPSEYHIMGVSYHAHLLGREMYTTLIPRGNDDPDARIDLKSRDVWTYEDQTPYPLDGIVAIKPGDKIQTTCVFNSTRRTDPTRFDLATYDEMCLNTIAAIFDTPPLNSDDGVATTPANEVYLRGFGCETTEDADIWLGELRLDDDARKIIDEHPLEKATCSFPTGLWIFDSMPSQTMRCSGDIVGDDDGFEICAGLPSGTLFRPRSLAGHSCEGGLLEGRDSSDGTTEEQCAGGGGTWTAYTCNEAQEWLREGGADLGSETKQFLREYVWAPKCCIGAADADKGDADMADQGTETADDEGTDLASTASSAIVASTGGSCLFGVGLLLMNAFAFY